MTTGKEDIIKKIHCQNKGGDSMDFSKFHELCKSNSCAEVARAHGVGVTLASLIVCEMGEKAGAELIELVGRTKRSLSSADRSTIYGMKKHNSCHNLPAMAKTLKKLGIDDVPDGLVSSVTQELAGEAERLWWAS